MEKQNISYTSEKLPVVSEAVIETLARDYAKREIENNTDNFMDEIKKRINSENQGLYHYLEKISNGAPKPEDERAFRIGVYLTYELLRRQTESDRLKEQNKFI